MVKPTIAQLKNVAVKKGYPIYINRGNDYNINIWGIRSGNPVTGKFNDTVIIFRQLSPNNVKPSYKTSTSCGYMSDGWYIDVFAATTKPSDVALLKPSNPKGTAIVVPGCYLSLWKAGKHKGEYEAFVQNAPVTVYRDNNKNNVIDSKTTETGIFGINFHRASKWKISELIGLYSEGCQVVESVVDFEKTIIPLRDRAVENGYTTFSYVLILESEIL